MGVRYVLIAPPRQRQAPRMVGMRLLFKGCSTAQARPFSVSSYAGFTIATHFYFGYVAVAVGWLVGKAMIKGSNGVGGLRYQIAAVALTYGAISLAAIHIMIAELAPAQEVDWVSKLPELAMWGIFSPFIELTSGLSGIIGLIILGAGIRFAWRITAARRLVVAGPYYI